MTSESCANGTERCAEALAQLDGTPDLIVNLQGDAPLTPHWFLEELIAAMRERQDVAVATPVLRCDQQTYTHFKDDRAVGRVGGTTAVFARDNSALYFSMEVLHYIPEGKTPQPLPVFHHVGVYAYRPEALAHYMLRGEGSRVAIEELAQLRLPQNSEKRQEEQK